MATTVPTVTDLPVDVIEPSPDNPRKAAGGGIGDIAALTDSVREQGILQRLVVCPEADGRYLLVFGERRLAAAKAAGLTEVPVEVRDYDEAQRFLAMHGENWGREDLSPLQEAFAYKQALDRKAPGGKAKLFTTRSLAERLGVSQSKISKYTSIFKLPTHVIGKLTAGELTITEAVHLVVLAKHPDRVEAALAAYDEQPHKDMDLAVRTQQADLDREAKVAATIKQLKAAKTRIAPDTWHQDGGRKLGHGFHEVDKTPEEHAGEPCHAAIVTHHGDIAWVCTDPDRHQPADDPADQPPAAGAAAGTELAADAQAEGGPSGAAAAAAGSAASQPGAAEEPGDSQPPSLAVTPEPSPEVLEGQRRMEAAREADRLAREAREQAAQELAEQLERAYEARTGALRTMLAGRISRPEATQVLARFAVCLAFSQLGYDDSYLRHVLSLGEAAAAGEESPVLAFAASNEETQVRAAVAVFADHAEEILGGAGEEPDFTHPIVTLYYEFLGRVAAYQPAEVERAGLGEDVDEPEPAEEAAAAEAPAEPVAVG